MSRRFAGCVIVALGLALATAAAADSCTVVVNGSALDDGQAICQDGEVLLSAEALERGLGLTVLQGGEGQPWTVRGFGISMLVRPNAEAFSVEDRLCRAPVAASLHDGALFVPLAMVREAFPIFARCEQDAAGERWTLLGRGVEVGDVREGHHPEKLRLVLDLTGPTAFSWRNEGGRLTLDLPAPADDGQWTRSIRLLHFDDELVSELRQGATAEDTIRVEITHSSPLPPEVFTLPDPPRVVVDLLRDPDDIPAQPEPPEIAQMPRAAGVLHTRNFCTSRGPVRVFVMEVATDSGQVEVRPALAGSTIHERATVAQMVASLGAYGGINGGFFARSGPPLGMLVIDGEWIRDPWGGRTVLGIAEDGRLLMDRLEFDGQIVFEGLGTQKLHALNRGHEEMDTLVMYTPRWGEFVAGAGHCTRLVVDASGVVTHCESGGRVVPIPQDGFVLSGNGRMARSLGKVAVGTRVTPRPGTKPQWPALRHAIGGGPRLVKDGRPHVTAGPERFRPDVYASAPSRSAVGFTRDGRLLLVAVEGRGEHSRGGMTLEEFATTLVKLGAWQAMNLDGGGSTSFVADGQLLNRPDDGVARRVSNALLVFTHQAARAETR